MSEENTKEFRQALSTVAQDAAREAGVIMRQFLGNIAVEKSKISHMDLVTMADKDCQATIEKTILAAFPTHKFLGEESAAPGAAGATALLNEMLANQNKEGGSPWLWVVDPIDGTTNFIHGIPCSVVSIAASYKGEVVVGVIYEPYRDEMFVAVKGEGAFLNGNPIRVDSNNTIKSALLAYGFHHTHHVASKMLVGLAEVLKVARGARCLGSAALHLAYVAAGRLTGFWELDLNSWDLAAGALLVAEAGGRITDTRGVPYSLHTRDMCATNGAADVHDGLLRVLEEANANSIN